MLGWKCGWTNDIKNYLPTQLLLEAINVGKHKDGVY